MQKIFFGIITMLVMISFTPENLNKSAENGKLSGIVTYNDAVLSSNQADKGCEIYAIRAADVSSTQYEEVSRVVEDFQRSKSEYFMSIYNTIDPIVIRKAQERFDAVSDYAFNYIQGLKQLPTIVKGVTSGSGKYAMNLRPGKYYVLFISGSLKSNNIPAFNGSAVTIKSAGEGLLDLTFEKSENTLFMVIARWQRQGC
jgi:hypothetical protein